VLGNNITLAQMYQIYIKHSIHIRVVIFQVTSFMEHLRLYSQSIIKNLTK